MNQLHDLMLHDEDSSYTLTAGPDYMYPNQNTPGVKKVATKNLKKAMLKKM